MLCCPQPKLKVLNPKDWQRTNENPAETLAAHEVSALPLRPAPGYVKRRAFGGQLTPAPALVPPSAHASALSNVPSCVSGSLAPDAALMAGMHSMHSILWLLQHQRIPAQAHRV